MKYNFSGLYLILILICDKGFSQNLVPNPSFENLRNKRQTMAPWQMVNTIDYFIYDETKKDQMPKTKIKDKNFKLRPARTGTAYVGLRVWPRYSEFLIVELIQPLEPAQQYYFEMYMCISPHANAYLRSIGASFYAFKPPYAQKNGIFEFPPQIEIYKYNGIIDTTEWFKIAGVFTAEGGERFLSIGNFSRNNKDKLKRRKFGFGKREAYYYIDDVALYKLDEFGFPIIASLNENIISDVTIEQNSETKETRAVDDYYRNIIFPLGSSELTYETYQKLGYIVQYLLKNPNVQIYIIGKYHSLEHSSQDELQKIAQKRAKNIAQFLTGNRINKNRISLAYIIKPCIEENSATICNSAEILFSNEPADEKRIKAREFRIFE